MDTRLVYFVQAGDRGPVKIGVAADPERRLGHLQVGHHERLRLLVTIPGGTKFERLIHRSLSEARLQGEWFSPTPRLERLVVNLRKWNEQADEHGWCERCCVRPVQPPRRCYCSDRCADQVARLRSRDWKRERGVA